MTDFQLATVARNKILEMVKEEQVVRYSQGIQEAYTVQYHHPSPVSIEKEIQKFILRQFGFRDDPASLAEYWKIASTYWMDEEIKNSIFYMKLNIFQYPKVLVGDDLVNCHFTDYATKQYVSLSQLCSGRPVVLLAGSMT